jgi:hypothetical protein
MMRLMTFLVLIICSTACFSQSRFLELDQNSLGLDIGYSTDKNRDIDGITGTIGYSSWGLLDLGISFSRVSVRGAFYGGKEYYSTISPYLSYLVMKQDLNNPISIGFSVSYQKTFTENFDVIGSHVVVGPGFFADLKISNEFFMQPNASFAFLIGKSEDIYSSNYSQEQNDSMFLSNIGFAFVFLDDADKSIFALNPAIAFQKDTTLFGLSASMLFIL